jgi:hypothetical protein
MAKLIPSVEVTHFNHESERDVANQLVAQLPDDCLIYHSYEWLKLNNGTLQEGEIDFVIVHPTKGILVIEVKGGMNITFSTSQNQWLSSSYKMKDPFHQARQNMHNLVDMLNKKLEITNFTYGYAVMFPNSRLFGALPIGVERSVLVTLDDMPDINSKINQIYGHWQRQFHLPINSSQLTTIRKALEGEFRLAPVLSNIITNQEEKLIKLTDDQCRILDVLAEQRQVLIKGVAGSGKTIMAMLQAKRFVDDYNCTNVLFVCYNKGLAESLKLALPANYQQHIHIHHFHNLCQHYTEKHLKIRFVVPKDKEEQLNFWKITAPSYLINACENNTTPKFDAIIVDEGQDFEQFWWYALEKTRLHNDIPYYIFYDPAQNLYVDSENLPEFGAPMVLNTNCRNTRNIISLCNHIIDSNIRPLATTPTGVMYELVQVQNRADIAVRVRQHITNLTTAESLKRSQIAILGPNNKNLSSISAISSINNHQITESYSAWRQNQGIYYSTIRSFKGLEADVVILIDFEYRDWETSDSSDNIHSLNDLYVAISRAKHQLIIITSDANIIQHLTVTN